MSRSRWTVNAGRTLCFDGREIASLARVTEPNTEIDPSDLDDLTREIASQLNASKRIVSEPYHARFCQSCERRNLTPSHVCECGCAIMVRR